MEYIILKKGSLREYRIEPATEELMKAVGSGRAHESGRKSVGM